MSRASRTAKERRVGVQCTLLVTVWALFLLLFLTTSISQRDQQNQGSHVEKPWRALFWSQTSRQIIFGPENEDIPGDDHCLIHEFEEFRSGEHVEQDEVDQETCRFGALKDSTAATGELTDGRLLRRHRKDDGSGEPCSVDSRSPPLLSGREQELEQPENSDSLIKRKRNERSSSLDTAVPTTRIILQESEEPLDNIDALQYAEYGAGLLQKSGPAEESTKICLIAYPGGGHSLMVSHRDVLSGHKFTLSSADHNLPSPEEVVVLEDCHAALSYGGDIVAELDPGESYLVCRRDLAGAFFCEQACTSQSECFLLGVDTNSCHYHGSIRDLLRRTCQTVEDLGRFEHRTTNSGLSFEIHDSVKSVVLRLPSQTEAADGTDNLLFLTDVGSSSGSFLPSQQELHILGEDKAEEEKRDVVSDGVFVLEDHTRQNKIDDAVQELTDTQIGEADDELFSSPLVINELTVEQDSDDFLQANDTVLDSDEGSVAAPEFGVERQEELRRLKRVGSVMSLDEYKRSVMEKERRDGHPVDLSSVQTQKMRHSDESYNYAAASHGAKLLASNKEAKGASHILVSDKDKYLRNPCGAEDKFVVLELSEETFVDTLVISNFEFHSSNLKDFELLGSAIYPAKDWISLGKFQAENVRHRQKFNIEDPKLVRYLMLKMLTHWGSEFFCTLSVVEVFGVDVIKNLLDDWIALEEIESSARAPTVASSQEESGSAGIWQQHDASDNVGFKLEASFNELMTELDSDQQVTIGRDAKPKVANGDRRDEDSRIGTTGDSIQEVVHIPGGKPPGDSVLKILMQRVKALELNQTLFDLYLGEINQKYKGMLSELDKDLGLVVERLRNEAALTASLAMRLADMELQRREEKLLMERQFALIASNFTDNLDFMRWQIQSMERREITAIMLALFCMLLSALLQLLARCMPRRAPTGDFPVQADGHKMDGKSDSRTVSCVCYDSSTFVLYLASGLTILVLSV